MTGKFVIRPPNWTEWPVCRELLPAVFPAYGRPPELLVAAGPEGIMGAAATEWTARGFPVAICVDPQSRNRGLGRALLAAALDSMAGETALVRAWQPIPDQSPAARLFQNAGFTPMQRLIVFDTDGTRFERATLSLLERVSAGRPDVGTLRQAPPDAVARLVSPYFTLLPHGLERQLTIGPPDGYDLDLSPVLLLDGQVAGAMLCRRLGQVLQIDLHVVAESARRTAASLRLVEAVTGRARQAGLERVRFFCDPAVRDTVNLGRRTGAVRLPSLLVLARQLF